MNFRFSKRAAYLALCGALFLTGCPLDSNLTGQGSDVAGLTVHGVQAGTKTCSKPNNSDVLIARLLDLVNEVRQERGLEPLVLNPILSRIADEYCCEMIEGGFFDHVNPVTDEGPGQRAINADYIFLAIGENLAGGQTTPEQVMNEWMSSTEGHRENILAAQWREIGIGVRTGGDFGVYWVQEFGNPP